MIGEEGLYDLWLADLYFPKKTVPNPIRTYTRF